MAVFLIIGILGCVLRIAWIVLGEVFVHAGFDCLAEELEGCGAGFEEAAHSDLEGGCSVHDGGLVGWFGLGGWGVGLVVVCFGSEWDT